MSSCRHWALVTVQHSATRFVREFLRPHFAAVGLPLTRPSREFMPDRAQLYQHHCNPSAIPHMEARRLEGVRIITTDRPREDILASHQRRYGQTIQAEFVYDVWHDEVEPIADVIIKLDGTEQDQLNEFVREHCNG